MAGERIYRDLQWTPEDRARHQAIRERFQTERPSLQDLIASGDCEPPIPFGLYLELRQALVDLQHVREAAGLSLADVAGRSGIDAAALGRLENGVASDLTVETVMRYAAAVGKRLTWSLQDLPTPAG